MPETATQTDLEFLPALPERKRGGPPIYESQVPKLRQRPGDWAKLNAFRTPEGAQSAVTALGKRFGPQGFEFASRGSDLYGRFHCDRCKAQQGDRNAPSHNGSRACRNARVGANGSIASGGTVAHCTCAGCF